MKILLTYAYAGVGHKKAAEAVKNALLTYNDRLDLRIVDILDYTNPVFKFLYPRMYLFLINRTPLLWGFFYYLFDLRLVDKIVAPLRSFFHSLQAKRFIRFVLEEDPDVIISTHFFSSEVVSTLKRKKIFKGSLLTIITDFLPHYFWMARESDTFIVAIERTKNDLIKRGIEEEKIKVLGIPCDPVFTISKDAGSLIEKLGLRKGFFNLLIMGGGFGTGPIEEIAAALCNMKPEIRDKIQLIVICGKNKNLFEKLDRKKLDLKVKLCVFGYMSNIDEFMEVSDCIITKSGGLTVSEALSKKLPMIIIQPILGQEMRNCKILTGYGTAVRANKVGEIKDYIRDFIVYPEKICGMKARINLLSYPNAAKDIAEFVAKGKP
ncbi:MAG: glycosyltransferase [Candidatus Omnitrophica bacterium]|nr:glycosyltransferase [Candidatus Omnitrophota bacterium]